MKSARLAIITDLNPISNPGANRIALQYAMSAQKVYETEFWTSISSFVSELDEVASNMQMRTLHVNEKFAKFPQKSTAHKSIREFSSFRALLKVLIWTWKFRPEVVWIHQIGNVFPYTVFLLFRMLRIPSVFTLHDYGVLVPRKLFPQDLKCGESLVSLLDTQSHESLGKLQFQNSVKSRMMQLRLFLQRFLLEKATLVSISSLQKNILEANGLRIDFVFPNGVAKCNCKMATEARTDNSILFAGRLTGKGFEKVVKLLKTCQELHLHIAGKHELENEAKKQLSSDRFTYYGELNQKDLNQLLHKVRFTAILSECFDVYPSLLLEALVHGSYPLTYPTVGNSSILRSVSELLVSEYAAEIECSRLSKINSDVKLELRIGITAKSLATFDEAFQKYHRVIDSLLSKR